ncbi:hypothetical protein J4W09_19510, partial [Escherichia coli]
MIALIPLPFTPGELLFMAGWGVNALSALHVQSRRLDKTRQASHPAIAPRHWRMRRERLIRPT